MGGAAPAGAGEVGEHDGGGGGVDEVVPPLVGGPVGDAGLEGREQEGVLAAGEALVLDGPAERQHRGTVQAVHR